MTSIKQSGNLLQGFDLSGIMHSRMGRPSQNGLSSFCTSTGMMSRRHSGNGEHAFGRADVDVLVSVGIVIVPPGGGTVIEGNPPVSEGPGVGSCQVNRLVKVLPLESVPTSVDVEG